MNYANYDENDSRLISGRIGSRKSATIKADGFEKRNSRKEKLIKEITKKTDWEKVNSKRRKAMNKAKEQFDIEVEQSIVDNAIESAIKNEKIAIIDNKTGDVQYVDSYLTDAQ